MLHLRKGLIKSLRLENVLCRTTILRSAWLLAFFLLLHLTSSAQTQIVVSGIVSDSTNQPLPFVAIQVKGEAGGHSTGEDATFYIHCLAGDTLIFTRLGYQPAFFAAQKNSENVTIIMKEMPQLLNNVTIYDKLTIPGLDDWKKDIKFNNKIEFRNPHQNPSQSTIPTFGPGIVIGFGGKSKNNRNEAERTRVYRQTVNSPEVRQQLMKLYSISEETFDRKLEAFNKSTPDAAYLTNREEIISMLVQYFARKEP